MPRFSIVVPAFNREAGVSRTVESILLQTYPDFELIVVDDASSDKTAEVIKAYSEQDARVMYVQHATNKGTHVARKTGTLAATGDYILYVDADDELKPEALEVFAHHLNAQPSGIVNFNLEVKSVNHNKRLEKEVQDWLNKPFHGKTSHDLLEAAYIQPVSIAVPWNLCGRVFKTQLAKKAFEATSDNRLLYGEDAYELLSILATEEVSLSSTTRALYVYNIGSGITNTHRLSANTFEAFFVETLQVVRDAQKTLSNNKAGCEAYWGFLDKLVLDVVRQWDTRVPTKKKGQTLSFMLTQPEAPFVATAVCKLLKDKVATASRKRRLIVKSAIKQIGILEAWAESTTPSPSFLSWLKALEAEIALKTKVYAKRLMKRGATSVFFPSVTLSGFNEKSIVSLLLTGEAATKEELWAILSKSENLFSKYYYWDIIVLEHTLNTLEKKELLALLPSHVRMQFFYGDDASSQEVMKNYIPFRILPVKHTKDLQTERIVGRFFNLFQNNQMQQNKLNEPLPQNITFFVFDSASSKLNLQTYHSLKLAGVDKANIINVPNNIQQDVNALISFLNGSSVGTPFVCCITCGCILDKHFLATFAASHQAEQNADLFHFEASYKRCTLPRELKEQLAKQSNMRVPDLHSPWTTFASFQTSLEERQDAHISLRIMTKEVFTKTLKHLSSDIPSYLFNDAFVFVATAMSNKYITCEEPILAFEDGALVLSSQYASLQQSDIDKILKRVNYLKDTLPKSACKGFEANLYCKAFFALCNNPNEDIVAQAEELFKEAEPHFLNTLSFIFRDVSYEKFAGLPSFFDARAVASLLPAFWKACINKKCLKGKTLANLIFAFRHFKSMKLISPAQPFTTFDEALLPPWKDFVNNKKVAFYTFDASAKATKTLENTITTSILSNPHTFFDICIANAQALPIATKNALSNLNEWNTRITLVAEKRPNLQRLYPYYEGGSWAN